MTPPMVDALLVAVPLEILAQQGMTDEARAGYARSHADALQVGADTALFGGGPSAARREGAAYFGALARVLAAMAYQPGGVTVFGQHWCTDHDACKAAAVEAAASLGLREQVAEPASSGRRIEDVPLSGGVL